jgi:hypothetical protein
MRDQIQSVLTTVNTTSITDPTSVDWNSFTAKNEVTKHSVSIFEVQRPYLISDLYYGDIIYTDILMLINRIDNPFKLKEGAELIIPDLEDLQNFVLLQKQKNGTSQQ